MSVLINASTSTGLVQSADTSGEIELQSNGTTALKVNTNEGIQILNCLGVGNATPSTSGAGITFPATQSASSDANTLDDYEEGTFTATLTGSSSAPSTPITTTGYYTKIGNVVHVGIRFENVNTTGSSGTLLVNGLPFTCATNPADSYGGAVSLYGMNFSGSYVYFYVNSGGTFMQGLAINSGGNWAGFNMTAGTAKYLLTSVTYKVA